MRDWHDDIGESDRDLTWEAEPPPEPRPAGAYLRRMLFGLVALLVVLAIALPVLAAVR